MYRDTENETEKIIPETYMWHYILKSRTFISNFTSYITGIILEVITYYKKQAQKAGKRKSQEVLK